MGGSAGGESAALGAWPLFAPLVSLPLLTALPPSLGPFPCPLRPCPSPFSFFPRWPHLQPCPPHHPVSTNLSWLQLLMSKPLT